MKLRFYLLVIVTIFAFNINAQVTIGSLDAPQEGAIFELKSDKLGFLPARVNLISLSKPDPLPIHVEGMIVFNKTVSKADTLQSGYYYNTGKRWMRFSAEPSFTENWFYMPSIVFDTSKLSDEGEIHTVNLYDEFKLQLKENTNVVSNAGARPQALSSIPAAKDLYYYITAYDAKVFEIISIDDEGLLSYRIIGTAADETFINIVFVEK